MSKIIMSPVDPKDLATTEEERKQLWFLLVDSYNEDIPCIICRGSAEDRAVFSPEAEYQYVYGLDTWGMKSIIYGICSKCKQFANELQIRENLKQAQRAGELIDA